MKIFDFGQNSYQYRLSFKIDCLSTQAIREIVEEQLVAKRHFANAAIDEDTGETMLSVGTGSEEAPLCQLRVTGKYIALWVGWHFPYERWKEWRTELFAELTTHFQDVSLSLVNTLDSQYWFLIPNDKVKNIQEVPEFMPIIELYRRFLPEKLLKRGNSYVALTDEDVTDVVEFWLGGGEAGENNQFAVRRNTLNEELDLIGNVAAHSTASDELVEAFSARFLGLIVRS